MKVVRMFLLAVAVIFVAAGFLGSAASAYSEFGIMGINSGMMGAGFGTGGMMNSGFMQAMMGNAGFRNMMNGKFNMPEMQREISSFDMNAMHRAMHGENSDMDMNAMHERMLAGNLASDDLKEMKEHCPMMG